MIKIFTGNDRSRATQAVKVYLGETYEVIDADGLTPADLPSIFLGASLFSETRHILLRDFSENKAVFEKLPDFLHTPHQVALLETKLDKRSGTYKILKDQIEIHDFPLPKNPNLNLVFDIFKVAKTDGRQAVLMLEKIKQHEEPIPFCGLLISQAIKDFSYRQGTKEKQILKKLSALDLELKSNPVDSWLLIEAFLLGLSSLQK